MRKTTGLSLAALGLAAALSATQAGSTPAPTKAKAHGLSMSGTIASADEKSKTLVVSGASGKTLTFSWTNATKVIGGPLAAGQKVTVRYLDKDGKHIVTSARVGAPTTPTAAPPTAVATAPPR